MSRRLAANARAAKEAFSEEVAQRLTDTRWFEADGDVVHGISDSARYADLERFPASLNLFCLLGVPKLLQIRFGLRYQ